MFRDLLCMMLEAQPLHDLIQRDRIEGLNHLEPVSHIHFSGLLFQPREEVPLYAPDIHLLEIPGLVFPIHITHGAYLLWFMLVLSYRFLDVLYVGNPTGQFDGFLIVS